MLRHVGLEFYAGLAPVRSLFLMKFAWVFLLFPLDINLLFIVFITYLLTHTMSSSDSVLVIPTGYTSI